MSLKAKHIALRTTKPSKAKPFFFGFRSFSLEPRKPQWRSTNDLRQSFIDYFVSNNHVQMPSASVVPHNDPSLLFTSAGMVQFKNYFLGVETPPPSTGSRVTTSQRCIRAGGKHNDLDNVGYTARHHTYFEMLGNFSFGDYFKEDAMRFAWHFLTKELQLPEERLRISVFETDDESARLWEKITGWKDGEASGKIFRMGAEDNFWQMGDTGPCGPCSEIYWDQLEEVDGDRFLEIWNLVFMQFDRQQDGTLLPLARPCVDTGMGLERLAAVMQGVRSNYESDDISTLVSMVRDCSPTSTPKSDKSLVVRSISEEDAVVASRVIADHLRSITALISDGVTPGNTGRGYVLRRIIRRAARYGVLLGHNAPFLHTLISRAVHETSLGISTPELSLPGRVEAISRIVSVEEAAFMGSLIRGMRVLDSYTALMDSQNTSQPMLPADVVFQLYDTYGFPLDLTQLCAREKGWIIDERGFQELLDERRTSSRATWSTGGSDDGIMAEFLSWKVRGILPHFIGYSSLQSLNATIEACYIPENELDTDESTVKDSQGQQYGYLSINPSPFYATGGGQVGDRGIIRLPSGLSLDVVATHKPYPGANILQIDLTKLKTSHGVSLLDVSSQLIPGTVVSAEVNRSLRRRTEAHHTATHLLHSALGAVLGEGVQQAGSLVNENFLRFDFTFSRPLTPEEINCIETWVNAAAEVDSQVCAEEMTLDEATARGSAALFGAKYDASNVRVVQVPGVINDHPIASKYSHPTANSTSPQLSIELCGGTHVESSLAVLPFKIISETGISSGVRRIEAVAGSAASRYLLSYASTISSLTPELRLHHLSSAETIVTAIHKQNTKLSDAVDKIRSSRALQLKRILANLNIESSGDNDTCFEVFCDRSGLKLASVAGWEVSAIVMQSVEEDVSGSVAEFDSLKSFVVGSTPVEGEASCNALKQLVIVYGVPIDDATDYEMFRKISEALAARQLKSLRAQGVANSLVQAFVGANGKSFVFRTDTEDSPSTLATSAKKGAKKGKAVKSTEIDTKSSSLDLSAADLWKELEEALPGSRGGGSTALAQGTVAVDNDDIKPAQGGFARRLAACLQEKIALRHARMTNRLEKYSKMRKQNQN